MSVEGRLVGKGEGSDDEVVSMPFMEKASVPLDAEYL